VHAGGGGEESGGRLAVHFGGGGGVVEMGEMVFFFESVWVERTVGAGSLARRRSG
jgi:hypothetical protein